MIKLLSLIGTAVVGTTALVPTFLAKENTNQQELVKTENGEMQLFVDNKQHVDNMGNIIPGTRDYKKLLVEMIEQQRAYNQANSVTNFKITNSDTSFPATAGHGVNQVGKSLERLINAKTYNILNMDVTIKKQDDFGNFTYAIRYIAWVNGQTINESLYGFQPNQSLTSFQISSGYRIDFDTEFEISKTIDHNETEYKSDIVLPNLGIKFLASQIIDMFNSANNTLNSQAIEYINKTMNSNLDIINAVEVHQAVKTGDKFEKGAKVEANTFVNDDFCYLTFTSPTTTGSLDMLIKS